MAENEKNKHIKLQNAGYSVVRGKGISKKKKDKEQSKVKWGSMY